MDDEECSSLCNEDSFTACVCWVIMDVEDSVFEGLDECDATMTFMAYVAYCIAGDNELANMAVDCVADNADVCAEPCVCASEEEKFLS
jgi:hypothetical protein